MSALSRFRPVAITAVLMAVVVSGGCGGVAPKQPVRAQCALDGAADNTLVFIIDPAKGTAVIANLPDAPTGTLEVTPFEYRMNFKTQGRVWGGRAVLNRYDGTLEREFGEPPYSTDGITVKSGNILQNWKCAAMKEAPLF